MEDSNTYKIVRFFFSKSAKKTILTGLTLEQARAHCNSPATAGDGWFDGYEKEIEVLTDA